MEKLEQQPCAVRTCKQDLPTAETINEISNRIINSIAYRENDVTSSVECVDVKPQSCDSCSKPIVDRYMSKVGDQYWHENCLKCCACETQLANACFNKDGKLYCKDDYCSLYGSKCSACNLQISPNDLVMKALHNIYHVECFKCDECGDRLEKGDEFILKEDKLYCSADFNVAEQRSDIDPFSSDEYESMSTASPTSPKFDDKNNSLNSSSCKRPRTILTSQQREDFKAAFEITPKPCRKVREQLSNETGLSVRVVQVWFQNQRAKLKKIQKKAEEGQDGDKVRKMNNQGKITKRKKPKPISSTKPSDDIKPTPDFHLPLSANITRPYTTLMDVNDNYTTSNVSSPYYPPPDTNHRNVMLPSQNNDFALTSPYPPYSRVHNTNMVDHVAPVNVIQSTAFNGFQIPAVSTDIVATPTTTQFQLMPHLMNSFI